PSAAGAAARASAAAAPAPVVLIRLGSSFNRLWAARRSARFGYPIGVTKGDGARSEPPALCGLHDDVAVRAAAHAALVADADDLRQHAHRPVGVLGDDGVGGVMAERVSGL